MFTYIAGKFVADVLTVHFVGDSLVIERTTEYKVKSMKNSSQYHTNSIKGENLQLLFVIELNNLLLAGSRVGNIQL